MINVPATGAPIIYDYDALGRLSGVVDPATNSVTYTRDAVGNVVSIVSQSSTLVSIINFAPVTGMIGDNVTINGTGFSTTASQNTVSFNGIVATVVSATATQIITTVPLGATTGIINITTPTGTASSATAFTVITTAGTPTINGFTPTIGTVGTAVSISGTNFDPTPVNDGIHFNQTIAGTSSATTTTLTTSVPSLVTSGHIAVTTLYGTAVSADDFFVPPAPYTAANVGFTGRMSVDGSGLSVSLPTSKIGLIVFNGTAGQTLGLGMSGLVTTPGGQLESVSVLNPDGSTLKSCGSYYTPGNSCDLPVLPTTGSYTLLVTQAGIYSASMLLTLSSDAAGTLAPNTPLTFSTTRVGQNARYNFAGTAGQNAKLVWSGSTFAGIYSYIYIYNPDGSLLASTGFTDSSYNMANGILTLPALPATGTYTVFVTPYRTSIGQVTLTLQYP